MRPRMAWLASFPRDTRGNVIIITAFSIFFMIAVAGAAVDFGRWAMIKIRTQQGIDAAAIAIAAMPATATATDQQNTLTRYFALNYSGTVTPNSYAGVTISPANLSFSASSSTISVSVTTTMPTVFIKMVGLDTLPISTSNAIDINQNGTPDNDTVVLFDETGSTGDDVGETNYYGTACPSRNCLMREAVTCFVRNVFGVSDKACTGTNIPTNTNPNIRIGIVGYSSHITTKWGLSSDANALVSEIANLVPTCNNYDHMGMLAATNMLKGGDQENWNGLTGTPPTVALSAGSNGRFGDTSSNCTVPPLTDTNDLAMPLAQTPRTNPGDANGISPAKNLILVTDGDIMTDPYPCLDSPNRSYDNNPVPPVTALSDCYANPSKRNYAQFAGITCTASNMPNCDYFHTACDAAKAAGIHIFVINFASPPTSGQVTAMEECASTSNDPNYAANFATDNPGLSNPYGADFYNASGTNAGKLSQYLNGISDTIKKIKIAQ